MNPYVIGGAALIIIILGWQLKSSLKENGELEANLIVANAAVGEAADANDSNMVTITTLKERITVMVDERRVDTEKREKVLDERDKQLVAAKAEAAKLKKERDEAFNENPDCADLASLSVEFFCPTVGDELLQRSTTSASSN